MSGDLVFIIAIVIVVLLLYWLVVYNSLVNGRNQIRRAFSGIDVQLKKRWDLVPQLVNIVKGYAVHESALLEKLIDARARAQSSSSPSTLSHQRINKEQVLTQHCSQVVALAESYPELKASEQFMMLQRNLAEIEAQVAASRRSYNAYVVRYNNAIESFPSNIIASRHEFRLADYFSIDLTERENVRL